VSDFNPLMETSAPQRTDEWALARVGMLTSSRVKPLMTAGGKQSKGAGADTLVAEMVAETILGKPLDDSGSSAWMDRGIDLEGEARNWLSMHLDADIDECGFMVFNEDGPLGGRVGASPDGEIPALNALAEFKCPAARNQAKYLLDPSKLVAEYRSQVELQMFVTGRTHTYLVSYCPSSTPDRPGLPPVVIDYEFDPDYREELIAALVWAVAEIDAGVAKLRAMAPELDADNPFA